VLPFEGLLSFGGPVGRSLGNHNRLRKKKGKSFELLDLGTFSLFKSGKRLAPDREPKISATEFVGQL